jgi:hypothetical protein
MRKDAGRAAKLHAPPLVLGVDKGTNQANFCNELQHDQEPYRVRVGNLLTVRSSSKRCRVRNGNEIARVNRVHPNFPLAAGAVLFQIQNRLTDSVPNGTLLLQTAGDFIE